MNTSLCKGIWRRFQDHSGRGTVPASSHHPLLLIAACSPTLQVHLTGVADHRGGTPALILEKLNVSLRSVSDSDGLILRGLMLVTRTTPYYLAKFLAPLNYILGLNPVSLQTYVSSLEI